jgi:putative transposase
VRDLAVLFLHLLATVARLAGPGGARSVVAESVLVKQQLLILNRSRNARPISVPLIAWSLACLRSSCAPAG